ncbi:MAG: RNA methyltransferase [Crocinitomicaceae bacterium]|nr:RNA methyltransferase [Crocinitomicaceae bacterium]
MSKDKELLDFLLNHITEERAELFEQVAAQRTKYLTVALEDLFQPHNASAVMRSCDCFGVQDLHIIENRNTFAPNKEIAMGSSKWLNLHRHNTKDADNTTGCINALKAQGYKVVATTPHTDDCTLEELDISQPIALLFGTEKSGLTENALSQADEYVRIPMYGFTESFNISVSAALSLFSVTERIRKSDVNWQLSEAEQISLKIEWAKRTLKSAKELEKRFYAENS